MKEPPKLIDLQDLSDERGSLKVVECSKELGFVVKRVYYFHGTRTGQERGVHAHKRLIQCLIAASGSVEIEATGGGRTHTFLLDNPAKGLLLPPGYWRVMRNFSRDAVLLVLASEEYDESDYISDFDGFLRWEKEEQERLAAVPYLDLKRYYAEMRAELLLAVDQVLASGSYILGQAVTRFEEAFRQICETKHAIGVSNGLDALALVLQAWEVGPGDEVVVPANSYVASALAVTHVHATPVFADIDPITRNLDVVKLAQRITPRTKVIMPVHLYGLPADMDGVLALARRHGVKVLEDAAQAHGARYKGRVCGGLADAAGFSFYPTKNLGAVGDAGIVCTNDDALADRVRLLRNAGSARKYHHEVLGRNARLDEIQAAFLSVKLEKLEEWTARRRVLANRYLEKLDGAEGLRPPTVPDWATPVWHVFAIEVLKGSRDAFIDHLTKHGVGHNIHYPTPIHLQPCYRHLGYEKGSLPCAEALADREISLPLDALHTDQEIDRVIEVVRAYFA